MMGLSTGGDAQQDGDHNLIDLHDDACGSQRNFSAIDGLCAVLSQQVVGQSHDDGDGKLGDETAESEGEDVAASFDLGEKCRSLQVDCVEAGEIGHRYEEGSYLTDDGGDSRASDAHVAYKDEDGV